MQAQAVEQKMGFIISEPEQIPILQDNVALFCQRFELDERYIYELQLVVEEFLVMMFENIGTGKDIPIYMAYREKAIRVIFNISNTSFEPIIAQFSAQEFDTSVETQAFMGISVVKQMVDEIKRIREAKKDEIHFIKYIGISDLKDIYGLKKRFPKIKDDLSVGVYEMADGTKKYTIRTNKKQEGQFFNIGEKEYFIFQQLDGSKELKDIVQEYTKQFNPISPRSINRFLNRLDQAGILEVEQDEVYGEEYLQEEQHITLLEKILSLQYTFPKVDALVTRVYAKFKWMFSLWFKIFMVLCIVSSMIFVIDPIFFPTIWATTRLHTNELSIIIYYYLIMLFTVVIHEFAHALTCKRYGGQVHKMGLMLYYFQICAYADTSDAWLFKDKKKRIWTALSGPFMSLFVASLCLWFYVIIEPVEWEHHLVVVKFFEQFGIKVSALNLIIRELEEASLMAFIANLFVTVMNLLPFLEMDGYFILADILEQPNIRLYSMGYVVNPFRRLLGKAPYPISPKKLSSKIGYAIYGSMCLIFCFGAAAVFLGYITLKILGKFGPFEMIDYLLISCVVLFFLKTIFLKRIQNKQEFIRKKVISY